MADVNGAAISLTVKAEEDIFADPEATIWRAKQHTAVLFRISMATKLKKLKRAFSQKVGVPLEAIKFTFGGVTVGDGHAACDLFMLDQDVILYLWVGQATLRLDIDWSRPIVPRASDFQELLNRGDFTDVILLVGPERVRMPAVKAVLGARSEKFRGMFSVNFWEGSQKEVALPTQNPVLMKILLQYLYTDKVEMPEDAEAVADLLMLAEEYMLPPLKRECEVALLSQVRERNVAHLLNTADMYQAGLLKDVCKQYILENFEEKPALGKELEKSPHLLNEITLAAVVGNKKRRLQ